MTMVPRQTSTVSRSQRGGTLYDVLDLILDKGLVIEPGKTVKLAPGGYHLMMFDLKGPLKQGDKLPVTLEFEKAGKVTVEFKVEGIGARGDGKADSHKNHANH